MNIDIIRLKSGIVDKIDIDEKISFTKDELKNTEILELNNVKVNGSIYNQDNDYYLVARIYGKMVLPCSLNLEPTDYEFDTNIEGNINEMLEEIGKNDKISENTIDILPIIWENILMEIPMKVINEEVQDVKLAGDGWRVITENIETINPELEKLKDLLK